MSNQWQELCAARKKMQYDSIPPEWLIKLPPDNQLNVMDVPSTCGLLTARELEITETVDVDIILRKLCSAEWSSVEVTTAFLKRAVVAQQLVRLQLLEIVVFF
jgi:amidase